MQKKFNDLSEREQQKFREYTKNICVNLAADPYFYFKCSKCGVRIDDYSAIPHETVAFGRKFKYCPECGRKVIYT